MQGEPQRDDIKKIPVPATELADSLAKELSPEILGDMKDTRLVANLVMFGAYLGTPAGQTAKKHLNETLQHFLAGKKVSLLELNRSAVERGLRLMSAMPTANR